MIHLDDERIRSTSVSLKSQDFQIESKILSLLQKTKQLTIETILDIARQSPITRLNPILVQRMFNNQQNLVKEMIDWMFTPHKMYKKKLTPPYQANKYRVPFECKQFIVDNETFFIEMVNASKSSQFPIDKWFDFIIMENKDEQTLDTSLGYFSAIMLSFLQILELSEKDERQSSENDDLLGIFSFKLLDQIIFYCHYGGIFKFIYRLAIRCFQEDEYEIRKGQKLIKKLFQKSCQNDYAVENMVKFLNQTYWNINCEDNSSMIEKHSLKILTALVTVSVAEKSIQRVLQSPLCYTGKQFKLIDGEEEEKVENNLKILRIFVKIYRQKFKDYQSITQTKQILKSLKQKAILIVNSITKLSGIVEKGQQKTIKFSSGEQITPITIVKYQYFQLLLECLLLIQQQVDDIDFFIDMNKLSIFNLIQRYLSQNRWNCNVHHCLQKIVSCLVRNNQKLFKKNDIQNSITDEFLGHLIQSFRTKQYVFLQSFRTTTQGNIHSIYKITYFIALELKSQLLSSIINKFQLWKEFIKTDLAIYHQNLSKRESPLDEEELLSQQSKAKSQILQIKIDQVEDIKIIVKKINQIEDWQAKLKQRISRNRQRKMYKSVVEMKRQSEFTVNINQINNHNLNHSAYPFPKKSLLNSMKDNYESNQSLTPPPNLVEIQNDIRQEESIDLQNSHSANNEDFSHLEMNRELFKKENPQMVKSFQNQIHKQQKNSQQDKLSTFTQENLFFSGVRK